MKNNMDSNYNSGIIKNYDKIMDKFIVFQTLLTKARFYTIYDPLMDYEDDDLFTIIAIDIDLDVAEKIIKEK